MRESTPVVQVRGFGRFALLRVVVHSLCARLAPVIPTHKPKATIVPIDIAEIPLARINRVDDCAERLHSD